MRAVVAAVAALMLSLFGLSLPFVIGWSLAAGSLVLLRALGMPDDPVADAPAIPDDPDRRATEVSRLAWAMNPRTGLAGESVTRRVRGILRHRLQRHGVDPDADVARCDALIGRGLWARLHGRAPTIVDIRSALDAIDRLSTTKEKQ